MEAETESPPVGVGSPEGRIVPGLCAEGPELFFLGASIKEPPVSSQANKALILIDLKSFRISRLREYPQKPLEINRFQAMLEGEVSVEVLCIDSIARQAQLNHFNLAVAIKNLSGKESFYHNANEPEADPADN